MMLKVEIAETPYQLERGLMYVDHLPDDEGMLFKFPREQKLNFWGRNTFIPLDIAFLDNDYKIVKIGKITPLCLSGVSSDVTCRMAIEANEGYFAKNKVQVGDTVKVEYDRSLRQHYVRFASGHNNEGSSATSRKDNGSFIGKLTQSQSVVPNGVATNPTTPPPVKVDKPGTQTVGDPIGQAQPQPMTNLPVLTTQDIGAMLEDSFDDDDIEQPEVPQEQAPEEQAPDGQQPEAPQQEYPQFNTAYEAMLWAEQNGEVVHISYTTKKGRQLERDVEPHGQFHSESTMRQILVTYDESVGDIRAFIISNIGSWTFVGKQFQKKFIVKG